MSLSRVLWIFAKISNHFIAGCLTKLFKNLYKRLRLRGENEMTEVQQGGAMETPPLVRRKPTGTSIQAQA